MSARMLTLCVSVRLIQQRKNSLSIHHSCVKARFSATETDNGSRFRLSLLQVFVLLPIKPVVERPWKAVFLTPEDLGDVWGLRIAPRARSLACFSTASLGNAPAAARLSARHRRPVVRVRPSAPGTVAAARFRRTPFGLTHGSWGS